VIRLLIDENLSPKLVDKLAQKGVFAQHAAHVGLAGRSDPEAVVTVNVRDFLVLAEHSDLHAGLIVLRESGLHREEQWARLEPVVERLVADGDDLVNRLVEVVGLRNYSIRDLPNE
jgi:hypothetical protein